MRYMSFLGALVVLSAALGAGCSSGGGGTSDGGSSSSGGSSSGGGSCSSAPPAVNHCAVYAGAADAGTGPLQFCDEYSGNDAAQNPSQGSCGPSIPGMHGVAGSGACPTADRLGGTCLSCGAAPNLVIAHYVYTTGPYSSPSQVQKACFDTYLP